MTRKDAIEEIKCWDLTPGERETLEALTPELRESEDAMMEKAIVDALLSHCNAINVEYVRKDLVEHIIRGALGPQDALNKIRSL